ncbi:MAG: stage V sporulation protein AE [Bacillota bacterium]|jgi:stage V sporulation protein AE
MDNDKKKVIIITDGDEVARKTVEKVAENIKGCCISASAGNPTPISGEKIVKLIKKSSAEPVLVMLDDNGHSQKGNGEIALEYLAQHPEIEVLGVLAVASNTNNVKGVHVKYSIASDRSIVNCPVDKNGNPEPPRHHILEGDTVSVLEKLNIPIIIGIGDIGKMNGKDHLKFDAPVTTEAIKYILQRSTSINNE